MKTAKKNIWIRIKEFFVKFYIKNKPLCRQDWIRLGILAVAIPVFVYSAWQLGYKLFTYVYEAWKYDTVIDMHVTPTANPFDNITISPEPGEPYQIVYATDTKLNSDGRLPEYQQLWERNNDMIGWITMPGFSKKPINYPIMYSGDNSYYVYRDFDQKDSYSGSIFMDGSNTPYCTDPVNLDRNYVIYGHAMRNRSMFGNITDYWENKTSWANNHTIYIDFMNTRLEYEVFSTFVVDPKYNYRQTKFSSDEEYQAYLNDMMAKSTHDFGIKVDTDDKIVTLSTCYKSTRRTAVIGKLVRQIIYVKGAAEPGSNATVTPVTLPTYIPMNEPSPTPRITPTKPAGITPTKGAASSSKPSSGTSSKPSSTGSSSTSSSSSTGPTPDITPGITPEITPEITSEASSDVSSEVSSETSSATSSESSSDPAPAGT